MKKSKFNDIKYVDAFEFCPVDPMHSTFIGLQKRFLKLVIKLRVSKFFSLKKRKREVDERIKNFNYNSKFKRRFRTLNNVQSFKAIEMLNWVFYLAPIVLRDVLNETEYGFIMIFIHSLSVLWNGGSKKSIELAHRLMRIFVEDLEHYFGEDELTINSHLHFHLKTSVFNYGPLKFNNAFIFESMNRIIKRLVKSSFGISKQILNEYNLMFFLSLDKEPENEELVLRSSFVKDNDVYYRRIILGKKVFTCWELDFNKSSRNCIVKLDDKKFVIIKCFYLKNEVELFVSGWLLDIKKNLDFEYNEQRLELNYIYQCEILEDLLEFKFSEILYKVHLVEEFDALNYNSCFVIDIVHSVHN